MLVLSLFILIDCMYLSIMLEFFVDSFAGSCADSFADSFADFFADSIADSFADSIVDYLSEFDSLYNFTHCIINSCNFNTEDIADDDNIDEKRKRSDSDSLNERSQKRTDDTEKMFIEKRLVNRRQLDLRSVRLENHEERLKSDASFVASRKIEFEYFTNSQTQRVRELRNER
jgi:hypothetical protein